MIRNDRALSFLLCIVLLSAACVSAPPGQHPPGTIPATSVPGTPAAGSAWDIPSDKYVFIDHHVSRDGEALSGTCSGGMMIDFPMYSFSRTTKELTGMSTQNVDVNESLKVVYGDGISLGGALGGGAATGLTAVYALPFEKSGVIIQGVTPDGSAIVTVANRSLTLPAGETWTNVTVTTGTDEFPGSTGACTIRITRTETVYNAGIVDKILIKND